MNRISQGTLIFFLSALSAAPCVGMESGTPKPLAEEQRPAGPVIHELPTSRIGTLFLGQRLYIPEFGVVRMQPPVEIFANDLPAHAKFLAQLTATVANAVAMTMRELVFASIHKTRAKIATMRIHPLVRATHQKISTQFARVMNEGAKKLSTTGDYVLGKPICIDGYGFCRQESALKRDAHALYAELNRRAALFRDRDAENPLAGQLNF